MHNKDGMNGSRRAFMKRASALSAAGVAMPWAINLAAMAEASAAGASDYKAVVCVFLSGGNDYANTVTPYDAASHSLYQGFRPNFAYARADLGATVLAPTLAPRDRNGFAPQYALAPKLAPLLPLFDSGKLGIILNIGPLIAPITKAQFQSKTVPVPPKLFSHNDQRATWQANMPEGATAGWGGRMGDVFQAGDGYSSFTCVNVASTAIYLSGNSAAQYQVSAAGPVTMNGLKKPLFYSSAASAALRTLVSQPRSHWLESQYNTISKRSLDANENLASALAGAPALATVFPANNSLGNQLKMVARMMSVAPLLGTKRQVFYVSLGGFDHHDNMRLGHPAALAQLGEALAAFQAAMAELNLERQVTTFTASDFGRTLTSNDNGTDHGWGSTQFVLGGAVNGKRYYGTAPVLADHGADDIGQGRLIPTTSVEQLAATLGKWMGISDSNLLDMLPNLVNHHASARNLEFMLTPR